MPFNTSYHVDFRLAAEFREKVKRGKDDFGAPGMFFSCETLRGVYDFEVTDANYFEKTEFAPYSVIIVAGQVKQRAGRTILEPSDFILCEGSELMAEAEHMVEYGVVSGQVFVCRRGYVRREDDMHIPRVECKGMGFVDSFDDAELYNSLPVDKSVLMRYHANVGLDTQFQTREKSLVRRNAWQLLNQRVEPVRPTRRPSDAGKPENK